MRSVIIFYVGILFMMGCTVEFQDLAGKRCTADGKCPPGLECDARTDTCIRPEQVKPPAGEGSVLASSGGKMTGGKYELQTVTGEPSVIGSSVSESYTEQGGFGSRLR